MASEKSIGVVNAEACLKKLGDDTLFVIERNIDEELVVYKILLNEKKDDVTGISMFWTKSSNLADYTPMTEAAKTMFYGVQTQMVKRGVHRMQVNCLSGQKRNRNIELHIKKSGKVIPKIAIGGKECTLLKIYIDITKFPPGINGLWVQGKFKDEILEERLEIDASIMDRVDLSDFMPTGFGI